MTQTYTQNVKIHFDSDTNAAKQQIQSLYDNLNKLSNINPLNTNMTGSISQLQTASKAASELAIHLKNATNVNTGRLNLKTFTNSLAKSGRTLSSFKAQLTAVGPEGTRTFQQLTQAIMMAEKPLFSLNSAMKSLGTTLLNSAKWQISSMAIHGIMGAAQKATGHVKALNSSLNDIRIVTGQTAEQMDKFAQKANKMAKELSTTTTAYTDAALIFYQQGLDDSAVEERTNTVIKMANVTGEAAEDVSSYMTAVWNNFDNGTKSLEYYADAMTALGAATASSTAEIAEGLEKFAAIADTVGLSYEYATSALATVVAETRQSADVVGTAFKTIFSRLESLQLGENLDDGTTLNKYSTALATVGVNIKDQQGQLKDMDQILDELGNKWQNLSRDQQVALAQTVAGTRQYTQLISLMENYETFKGNVDIASGAEGTLQEQADIYADSWEAASKRVKASAETIYQSLLDDDFFIDLNNGFATFLDSIGLLIDGMGGLKGILPAISSLLFSMFGTQIAGYIDTISLKVQNFGIHFTNLFRSAGNKKLDVYEQQRQQAGALYASTIDTSTGGSGKSINMGQGVRLEVAEQLKTSMGGIAEKSSQLSGIQKTIYDQQREQLDATIEETIELGKQASLLENQVEARKALLQTKSKENKNLFSRNNSTYIKDEDRTVEEDGKKTVRKKSEIVENLVKDAATKAGVEDAGKKISVKKGQGEKFSIGRNAQKNTPTLTDEEGLKTQTQLLKEYTDQLTETTRAQTIFKEELGEELSNNLTQMGEQQEITSDTSVEDIEKQGQVFNNMTASVDKATERITAYESSLKQSEKTFEDTLGPKAGKALRDFSTSLGKVSSASKAVSKEYDAVAKAKKKVDSLTPGTKKHQKAEEELSRATERLKNAQIALQTETQESSDLQKAFSQAVAEGKIKTEDLAAALKAIGYTGDLTSVKTSIENMANTESQAVDKTAELKHKIEELNNTNQGGLTFTQHLTQAVGAMSQLAMGINAVKSIGNIWSDEDASIGEKILSTAMALPMALSAVGAVTKIVTGANKVSNAVKLAGIKGDKEAIKTKLVEIGTITAESSATWANTVAKISNLLASPWTWALAAIAIAAITAVSISMSNHTKALEADTEAKMKNAESTNEQVEKNKELLDTYREAKDALDETYESKVAYRDATMELVKAYEIENGAILLLTGQYEKLDKAIKKAREKELTTQAKDNRSAAKAKINTFIDDLSEGSTSGGKYKAEFDDDGGSSDEWAILKAVKALNPKSLKYNSDSGDITTSIDYSNPDAIVQYYNDLKNVTKYAADLDKNILDSDIYGDMMDEISVLEEKGINDVVSSVETAQQADIEKIIASTTTGVEDDGKGISEISTIDDYNAYVSNVKGQIAEKYANFGYSEEKIKELQDEAVSQINSYSDAMGALAVEASSLDEINEKFFKNDAEGFNEFVEYYNSLDEGEKQIALTAALNTSGELIIDELENAIQDGQIYADSHSIQIDLELTKSISQLIEEDVIGNKNAIKEKYEKSFEKGLTSLSWDEFYGLGKEGMLAEVEKWSTGLTNEAVDNAKQVIAISNQNIQASESNIETAQGNIDSTLKNNLAIMLQGYLKENYANETLKPIIQTIINDIGSLSPEEAENYVRQRKMDSLIELLAQDKENYNRARIDNPEAIKWTHEDYMTYYTNDFRDELGFYAGLTSDEILSPNNSLVDVDTSGAMIALTKYGNWEKIATGKGPFNVSESVDNFADSPYKGYVENTKAYLNEQDQAIATNEELIAQNQLAIEEAQKILDQQERVEESAIIERLGISTDEVTTYTDALVDNNEQLEGHKDLAQDIALDNIRMNKGITNLSSNFEKYSKTLRSNNKDSSEYTTAMNSIRENISDILGLDIEDISDDFIKTADAAGLLEKAAQGDAEAIEELRKIKVQDIFDNSSTIQNLDELSNYIETAEFPELRIGASIDSDPLYEGFAEMIKASGMTAQEMEKALESFGFEPTVEYVPIESATLNKANNTYTYTDDLGNEHVVSAESVVNQAGAMLLPIINAKKTVYKGAPAATINNSNRSPGGGGGGREKKKYDDEFDRYHEIEREMEALERETSRLGEAKDLAFGASKVALINQETEALKNELGALEQLNSEVESYLAQDKANIAQFGAEFDEFGNISNYDEITQYALDQYNSGAWSEEKYEAFKEYLEQYEETLDKWNDTQDDMTAKQREILEKALEKIELQVQLKIDVSEDSLEYLEYQLSKIEDEAFTAADAIALITEEIGATMEQGKAYQQGLSDLEAQAAQNVADGIAVESGGWTEDMIAQAREYKSALLENNQQLEEYRKLIEEKITEALDEMNEKLDEQIGRFDTYGAILGHYTTILGLSGKSIKNASLIIDLGNKTVNNSINKLESTRHKQEVLEQSLIDAQAEYESALSRGDSEAAEYWRETIEDITMQVEQGKETLLATFEETLQTAADTFAAAVEQTVATLSAALTKYSSLEVAQDQYDKQKEIAERFLDINTKNYELSKLMRNINAEINKTDNLAAKTKLRDVLEEINDIQANNNEMTQYDLDMLNAKYQLRLAEIALEEAQNAKSQVRLTQTAGGGWGYVYTADQAQVDQAQQNYEDKLYEMQQLSQERVAELSDYILQNQQEMNDAIANLRAEDFESREAYLAEIDRIRDYYLEKDQYLHEQLGKAVEDSGQKYSDTILSQIEGADSWEEAHQNVVDSVNEALDGENGMVSHYENWQEQVSNAYEAAGISEDGFKDQVVKDAKEIMTASNQVKTAIESDAKAYSDYLASVMTAISGFQTQYGGIISGFQSYNEQLVINFNNMVSTISTSVEDILDEISKIPETISMPKIEPNESSNNGSNNGGNLNSNSSNGRSSGSGGRNMFNGSNLVQNTMMLFDTGGYTGAWGSEGRMAMLHEKEIVLNKIDTENLLASIEIVRSIANQIDAIGNYQRMQELISAYGIINNPTQQLEQNVHITADFPNVTDHNEIEEAINNLLNYSSQYINRYRQ